jgi:hypothetical protein
MKQVILERKKKQHILFSFCIDITPSAPPEESHNNNNNNDSIRRYFQRLTLLETIYEKLNMESNKTPVESIDHQKLTTQKNINQSSLKKYQPIEKRMETKEQIINHPHTYSSNTNKFVEMNVDGNGSISSSKSSLKRRAPTAPHISQNNKTPVSI